MEDNVNPPAFATATTGPSDDVCFQEGMSLRDWYAGQALAGLLANPVSFGAIMQGDPDTIASACGTFADAMIAERAIPS
jgi:hypothetical protein